MDSYSIVTGANDAYFETLLDFIQHYIEQGIPCENLVIYDLGFNDANKLILESKAMTHNFIIKQFEYAKYPDHVNLKKYYGLYCSYAFKPICIYNEALVCQGKIVIWLDTAVRFSKTDIHEIITSTIKYGIYSPIGNTAGSIESIELNFPQSTKAIGLTKEEHNTQLASRYACIIAVQYNNDCGKYILDKWYEYALTRDVIMPDGSSRNNHRQDQTILSALMFLWEKHHNMKFDSIRFGLQFCNKINVPNLLIGLLPYKLVSNTGQQLAIIYSKSIDEATTDYINRKQMTTDEFQKSFRVMNASVY